MELLTTRRGGDRSTDDHADGSREWERPRRATRVAGRRFAVPVAVGAAAAFALAGLAVLDAGHETLVPALASAEPAVAAADLPPGAMYHVVDQIDARALWARGVTGDGVNVAVIDTGIAPVESLTGEGKVVAAIDFSAGPSSTDTRVGSPVDVNGHGTFVAGIIAGREPGADPAAAAEHPEWFLGVAPDAGIVSVKVDDGIDGADRADVISGIDWVVDHADELHVGVINLSYDSGLGGSYLADPLAAAVERAWDEGIVVVAAAGNDGAHRRRPRFTGARPLRPRRRRCRCQRRRHHGRRLVEQRRRRARSGRRGARRPHQQPPGAGQRRRSQPSGGLRRRRDVPG